MHVECPICHTPPRRLFEKHGYGICRCDECRYRWAEIPARPDHVSRVYGDDYFEGGGAGYSDYASEGPILAAHGRRYGEMLRRYTAPGHVLDVGAAAGFILKGFCESGWSGRGIEPNDRMAEHARTRLGLDVRTGTLEELPRDDHYDLISMIQVLSHFVDVTEALDVAASLTRPGGFWLIETWNPESWSARVFGRHWHAYSPPSVLHWFSPAGLERLTARFGFSRVTVGKPAKWINGGHAKSLLRFHLAHSWWGRLPARVADVIPDRLSIRYPSEDVYWMLFRKGGG